MIRKKKAARSEPQPVQLPEQGEEPGTAEAPAEGAAGGEAPQQPSMELLLEDARAKADQHWDRCLRLQAELDNLQKRSRRELENAHKYALERFSAELLAVKDSLEMGLAAVDQENVDPVKLKEGTELTLKLLNTIMEKFEIREVNPTGQRFDPEFHQAISTQERVDVGPNTVVNVIQKGYLLHDRLIRPAMVIVSRATQEQNGSKVDEKA